MTDAELVERFADMSLLPAAFGHREHVRLAFALLARHGDFGDAALDYRRLLRAFAVHHGAPEKYHETITWAYLAIVHARMTGFATSDAMLAANPDLLDHRRGALARYYDVAAADRGSSRAPDVRAAGRRAVTKQAERRAIERVQTGVRMEKRLVLVLKALAGAHDLSFGDLLEGIVLHAFEGKAAFGLASLAKIEALRGVYGLDLTAADSHLLVEKQSTAGPKHRARGRVPGGR